MGFRLRALCWTLLLFVVTGCSPPEQRQSSSRRELVLSHLTEAALRTTPGAAVLVIGNPYARVPGADSSLREAEDASLEGVQRAAEAARARFLGIAHPRLRPEALRDPTSVPIPPGATTPLSFLTEPGAWDRIQAEHREANLWVSLIGVPADLAETKAWVEPGGPRWALFLPDVRLIGTQEEVRSAFESGRLAALVLARPGAPPEAESMVADPRAEFERRYVLVTRDSLKPVVEAWPQLIP